MNLLPLRFFDMFDEIKAILLNPDDEHDEDVKELATDEAKMKLKEERLNASVNYTTRKYLPIGLAYVFYYLIDKCI